MNPYINIRNLLQCFCLLIATILMPAQVFSRDKSRHVILEYNENGEHIKVYTWHHGGKRIAHITLVNYNRRYSIIYPLKGSNCLVWLTEADFLKEKDFYKIGYEYMAINDAANYLYSTTSHFRYPVDSLKDASRIYLTKLEQDLLAKAIKLRIEEGPENPEYFGNPIDPYSILYFLCVKISVR